MRSLHGPIAFFSEIQMNGLLWERRRFIFCISSCISLYIEAYQVCSAMAAECTTPCPCDISAQSIVKRLMFIFYKNRWKENKGPSNQNNCLGLF